MMVAYLKRAFWPPDSVTPRSPISVRSPEVSCLMSDSKAQARSVRA